MKRLAATIALLALFAVVPTGVVAQAENGTQSGPGVEMPKESGVQVQDGLVIVSSSYTAVDEMQGFETGEATIVLRSDSPVAVTLADAGAFFTNQDREINRRTVVVNGRAELKFAVTERNGRVGVSISTDETLYGHVIRKGGNTDFVPGGPSPEDTWLAGATIFGLFAVAMPGAFIANRKMRGKEHDQH
ncbi:hypothetical protein ACFQMA_23125 [Halosimplex aquaticum]|uniref:PGF-CTERM protein n=1 Tax=Halosimplex aquaticum TaxID=3026162 RepID=A0ABD5YAJ1_9EURY|nr:hypothetical protein [Halosimplex aquaticum]